MYYIVICFVLFSFSVPEHPPRLAAGAFYSLICSTPPLKKKNKIFTSNCAVCSNTGGVFFGGGRGCYPAHIFCRSGAAGVGIRSTVFYRLYCYRRHSLPGSLFYTGCYPAHNSGEPALESPAQFTAGGVVIGSTISVRCASRGKKNGCYRTHNSDFFSAGGRLLSTAQFARWVKFGYCYRQHISEFRPLSKRVRTGLLSSAHFRQWGCYRAHSFQTVEFWRLLLSTAHF